MQQEGIDTYFFQTDMDTILEHASTFCFDIAVFVDNHNYLQLIVNYLLDC